MRYNWHFCLFLESCLGSGVLKYWCAWLKCKVGLMKQFIMGGAGVIYYNAGRNLLTVASYFVFIDVLFLFFVRKIKAKTGRIMKSKIWNYEKGNI